MSGRYLLKRGNSFSFRIRVPSDLRHHLKATEIWRSLHTSDRAVARELARPLVLEAQRTFAQLRASMQIAGLVANGSPLTIRGSLGNTTPEAAKETANRKRLRDAVNDFTHEQEAQWTAKTTFMHKSTLARFTGLLGNLPVSGITRADCRRFRDQLLTCTDGGSNALKPATVNRHLGVIGAFFQWTIKEGLRSNNPCIGLKLKRAASIRTHEERDAFTPKELLSLLGSPVGSSMQERTDVQSKPSRLWLPVIALLTGMRLEEIAQLRPGDVKIIDGVSCLDVNARDGKRLKTASSQRLVPIHPHLITMGFEEYARERAEAGESALWPDLKADGFGSLSSKFSKWFTRYRRSVGVDRPSVSFHSFRHTFIDALKRTDIPEAKIRQIVGHAETSITIGRYGKLYGLDDLLEALTKGCERLLAL